jgi:hypothetical protein
VLLLDPPLKLRERGKKLVDLQERRLIETT